VVVAGAPVAVRGRRRLMSRLALAGGPPVRARPFPAWPVWDEADRDRLIGVLESGAWGGFPFPNRWAEEAASRFAASHGARHGLAVANGTVAIEVALRAAGIGPGDEVIVPAYTFEASAAPVLRLGAVPVFVDVRPETYGIDVAAAEAAVTPRTRAIVPVHLAMSMADMDAVGGLVRKHGLVVVEDCAHAHGAAWRGRGAGSWGDAGAFSLQTSKLVTTGEGGLVTTSDDRLLEAAESYVNCGRASRNDRFGQRLLGFNYRMTEMQAALLIGQIERLPAQTEARAARAARLAEGLRSLPGIALLEKDERQTAQAFYQYVFKYDGSAFGGAPRDRFVAALEAEGIPCDGLFYEPVYRSALFPVDPAAFPALGGRLPWAALRCPVAERAAYEESVWIPHRVLLGTDADVDHVVEAVAKIAARPDELRTADHPLVAEKARSRAVRDSGPRTR
jgi:dTDP-4-amino-4,6-dideoxygalactose transaminase